MTRKQRHRSRPAAGAGEIPRRAPGIISGSGPRPPKQWNLWPAISKTFIRLAGATSRPDQPVLSTKPRQARTLGWLAQTRVPSPQMPDGKLDKASERRQKALLDTREFDA